MDFKEGRSGEDTNFNNAQTETLTGFTVREAPEFEDVEGEQAFGVYSGSLLLGVFWNKEFANIFKNSMQDVDIKVVKE